MHIKSNNTSFLGDITMQSSWFRMTVLSAKRLCHVCVQSSGR